MGNSCIIGSVIILECRLSLLQSLKVRPERMINAHSRTEKVIRPKQTERKKRKLKWFFKSRGAIRIFPPESSFHVERSLREWLETENVSSTLQSWEGWMRGWGCLRIAHMFLLLLCGNFKELCGSKKNPFFATRQLGCGPRSCNKREKFSGFYVNSVLSNASLFMLLCRYLVGGTQSELSCLSDVISGKLWCNW